MSERQQTFEQTARPSNLRQTEWKECTLQLCICSTACTKTLKTMLCKLVHHSCRSWKLTCRINMNACGRIQATKLERIPNHADVLCLACCVSQPVMKWGVWPPSHGSKQAAQPRVYRLQCSTMRYVWPRYSVQFSRNSTLMLSSIMLSSMNPCSPPFSKHEHAQETRAAHHHSLCSAQLCCIRREHAKKSTCEGKKFSTTNRTQHSYRHLARVNKTSGSHLLFVFAAQQIATA